jgi:hypothetical protein
MFGFFILFLTAAKPPKARLLMAHNIDWLPTTRAAILAMVIEWIAVCTPKKTAWGIPDSALTELAVRRQDAEAALNAVENENSRTSVVNARCKEAFAALTGYMRDFKRRYFLSPPLTDADFVSLGLKPYDRHPSPSRAPTAQVQVETYLVGRHELGVRIIFLTGSPEDPANKSFRIWYSVIAPGEPPPSHPRELREWFFTHRRKDLIGFAFEDSGKRVYFAVQVENGNKKGPWGPMVSALIP